MKIKRHGRPMQFKPFEVTLTIENKAELAAMLAILNQSSSQVLGTYQRYFTNVFNGITDECILNVSRGPLYTMWELFNEAAKELNEQH